MKDLIYFEKPIINTKHKYVNFQLGITKGKFEECSIFLLDINWHMEFLYNLPDI